MTAYLVTGGCGFIGQALIARLLGDRDNVVRVIDDLSSGRVENLQRVVEIETVAARALRPPQRRITRARPSQRETKRAAVRGRTGDGRALPRKDRGVRLESRGAQQREQPEAEAESDAGQ